MFLNLYSEAKVCRYLSNFRDQFQLRFTFASFDVLDSLGGVIGGYFCGLIFMVLVYIREREREPRRSHLGTFKHSNIHPDLANHKQPLTHPV